MIFNKNNKYITLLLSLILVPVRAEGDPPTLPSDHKDGATLEATTQTAAVPVVKRRRSDSSCLPTKPPTARTTHPPSRAAVLQKQIDTMTMELAGLQETVWRLQKGGM